VYAAATLRLIKVLNSRVDRLEGTVKPGYIIGRRVSM
jgi:hypothetical protein